MARLAFVLIFLLRARGVACEERGLVIPYISGDLTTPAQLHRALAPAWDAMVEERNNAGLVAPKDEGKPQPPLSEQETAFQFERVQKGQVDSARLLLVFGMVPSASHVDNETMEFLKRERDDSGSEESSNLPVALETQRRYPDGSTPLHMAATFGLPVSIRALLDAGADINARSMSDVQPIHAAAIMGHANVVELLVQRRADVDSRHSFADCAPIHFAAEMGHTSVVRRLCELGADVEAEKKQGGTAVHVSADTNNAAVTRILVEEPCGADPEAVLLGDTVPLYLAAGRGFNEVIDVLIEAGAGPDRTLWPQRPWQNRKRKRKRKRESKAKEVALAVDPSHLLPGSDPRAPGYEAGNGATALHNAAENGHLRAVVALLDGGARQLATMEGVTPLIMSLQYRHRDVAAGLLDHKTDANVAVASPRDGQTALHIASAYDYPEVVARILLHGGSTEVVDRRGHMPLEYARGDLTRWLLNRFQGRDPRLDALVRAHSGKEAESPGLGLEARVLAAAGPGLEVKRLYADYARRHAEGSLQEEAAQLAKELSSADTPREAKAAALRRFSICRFLLAGSDAPVAVEAMMKKTETSVHVGLALLGIRVESLQFKAGAHLRVNGHDVADLVSRVVQAALQSAQQGDAGDFEAVLGDLRAAAAGLPAPTRAEDSAKGGATPEDDDEEGRLEL